MISEILIITRSKETSGNICKLLYVQEVLVYFVYKVIIKIWSRLFRHTVCVSTNKQVGFCNNNISRPICRLSTEIKFDQSQSQRRLRDFYIYMAYFFQGQMYRNEEWAGFFHSFVTQPVEWLLSNGNRLCRVLRIRLDPSAQKKTESESSHAMKNQQLKKQSDSDSTH